MVSLFDSFSKIRESYYRISIKPNELFADDCGHNARQFIDEHFERGAKKGVFAINREFATEYTHLGKHHHTVSLYLLGLKTKDLFRAPIRNRLNSLIDDLGWFKFEYSWYLTCLYHDVSSCIEDKPNHKELIDAVDSSALFTHKALKPDANLLRFPKELIINYLNYRAASGRIEHGIIGGTMLFDKLKESFIERTKDHNWEEFSVYQKDNLNWRREHLDHFAYVADAVCCHNLWTVQADSVKCAEYQKKGLDPLIIRSPADRIYLREYPLQFMLFLLDTIEPVKRFKHLDPKTVLKNIYTEISPNTIVLYWTQTLREQPEIYNWLDSIRTLPEWMCVYVSPCEHHNEMCSIKIVIQP